MNFMFLSDLEKNKVARISNILDGEFLINAKLREVGFAEGDEVEIIAYGPVAKTPICVRLNRTMIAQRPNEAKYIEVEL